MNSLRASSGQHQAVTQPTTLGSFGSKSIGTHLSRIAMRSGGHHNLCKEAVPTIVGHMGGFAEQARRHWSWAIAILDGLDPATAGRLPCGGRAVYGPFAASGIRPADRVGIGGLGISACNSPTPGGAGRRRSLRRRAMKRRWRSPRWRGCWPRWRIGLRPARRSGWTRRDGASCQPMDRAGASMPTR